MEWAALSFDENPRVLLHIAARARVLVPVGCWCTWAAPSWSVPVLAWAARVKVVSNFPAKLLMFIQFSFQAEL